MCMSSPWNIWLLCWRVSRIQFSLFSASGYLPRTTLPFPRTQNRHGTTWLLSKCLNVFIIPVSWFLHNGCDLLPDTSDRAHLPKHDGRVLSDLFSEKEANFPSALISPSWKLFLVFVRRKTAPTSWLVSLCAAKQHTRLLVHRLCNFKVLTFLCSSCSSEYLRSISLPVPVVVEDTSSSSEYGSVSPDNDLNTNPFIFKPSVKCYSERDVKGPRSLFLR